MELNIIDQGASADKSTVLQWARRQFLSVLPLGVAVVDVDEMTDLGLYTWGGDADRMDQRPTAHELLVRLAFLGLTSNTFNCVTVAVDQVTNEAFSRNSRLPCPIFFRTIGP